MKKQKKIPQVGDIVRITKSGMNWGNGMDAYIGLEVEIVHIDISTGNNAQFKLVNVSEDINMWNWNFTQGHFELVGKKEPDFIFDI